MKKLGFVKSRVHNYTKDDEACFQLIKEYYGLAKDVEVQRQLLLDKCIEISTSKNKEVLPAAPVEKPQRDPLPPEEKTPTQSMPPIPPSLLVMKKKSFDEWIHHFLDLGYTVSEARSSAKQAVENGKH